MPNSTVMTVAAIFKSRLLKWPLQEKFTYLCNLLLKKKVNLNLQVRLSIQSLHR